MIALRGIASNSLRSTLTVLGITIGVAAVIVLVAVGRGSAVDVQNRIESLGTNILTVMPGGGFGFGPGGATRTGTSSSFRSSPTRTSRRSRTSRSRRASSPSRRLSTHRSPPP